jgi:CRISPR-associated protein Csx10
LLCQALLADERLRRALTFAKPGVRIDPATGSADKDHLRFDEMVRAGTPIAVSGYLEGDGWSSDVVEAAQALLRGGLEVIARLGGKRRRGAGRVKISASGLPDSKEAVERLRKDPPGPEDLHPPPTHAPVPVDLLRASATPTLKEWAVVDLHVEALTPVVVAQRVIGNVTTGLDYIPGTFLLGPVVAKLPGGWDHLLPAVQAGSIRVLNAYPEIGGARGLPVPLALFRPKVAVLDTAANVWNLVSESSPPQAQTVQVRRGFLSGDAPDTKLVTIELGTWTHSTVEDESQRPTAGVGGVYTYQAIPPGRFRSRLLVRGDVAARFDSGWDSLHSEVSLGTSKSDDYGNCWLEARPAMPDHLPVPSTTLVVWLLSDVLIRDRHNGSSTTPHALAEALGERLGGNVTVERAFARIRRSDRWSERWGFPKPSLVGLVAGSVLRLSLDRAPVSDQLAELVSKGVGERTAEGFGEIAINPPILATASLNLRFGGPDAGGDPPERAEVTYEAEAFLSRLREVAWWDTVHRAVLHAASSTTIRRDILKWTGRKPPNSQLGALRAALRSSEFLDHWVKGVTQVPSRRDKWPEDSLKRLEGFRQNPEPLYESLELRGADPKGAFSILALFLDAAVRHELRVREGGPEGESSDG